MNSKKKKKKKKWQIIQLLLFFQTLLDPLYFPSKCAQYFLSHQTKTKLGELRPRVLIFVLNQDRSHAMEVMRLFISAVCTVLSFLGLQFWTELSNVKLHSDGLIIGEHYVHFCVAKCAVENPYITTALVLNFILNVYALIFISLKTIYATESWKLVQKIEFYVLSKGASLLVVVPLTLIHAGLWSTWLTVACTLKMFEALARERLERSLNTSSSGSSARLWNYLGDYSVLLVVFTVDAIWITTCALIHKKIPSPVLLLLFFEPLGIAFKTLKGILVHGFQLLDILLHHSARNTTNNSKISKLLDTSAAAGDSQLKWERKRVILRNVCFFLDIITWLIVFGHYVYAWRLNGKTYLMLNLSFMDIILVNGLLS
ncbi:unnamed protein product [Lactuca virosa]|uniref:Uncharacterized protein n=1 Tax=Lactuca virosa TaxID=75947 RepID=A0AAU9NLW5_9ASTR|nr:unnamed protein product [Lactuca virosa]